MGKVVMFNDYLYKKKLSKTKFSKEQIMSAKEKLLVDDDYGLYEDEEKALIKK